MRAGATAIVDVAVYSDVGVGAASGRAAPTTIVARAATIGVATRAGAGGGSASAAPAGVCGYSGAAVVFPL